MGDEQLFSEYNLTQNSFAANEPVAQKHYGLWILIGLGIFFSISLLLLWIFLSGAQSISEKDFLQGTNVEIKENSKVDFEIDAEEHSLTVENVGSNSVNILIQSEPLRANLKIGEEKKFDIDDDGDYDVLVRLISIEKNVPNLYVKRITETIVLENDAEETENDTNQNNAGNYQTNTTNMTENSVNVTNQTNVTNAQNETNEITSCQDNSDCSKTCIGCDGGVQSCAFLTLNDGSTISRCADCVNDFSCLDDYKCKDNNCIKWECDSKFDCDDEDFSTAESCNDFSCLNKAITECKDYDFYCPPGCTAANDNDCGGRCGTGIVDCGTSELVNDCYLEAAKGCCPAKIITNTELNFFGMITSSEYYREIKGLEGTRCAEYSRLRNSSISYSDEVIQAAISQGKTQEEIDQQIEETNLELQDTIGNDGTCDFIPGFFFEKLENESNGYFSGSTSDVNKYDCSGSLYGTA